MKHRESNLKIYVGNENGWHKDRVEWVKENFSKDSYMLIDEGFMIAEYFILFKKESDALMYRLRWH